MRESEWLATDTETKLDSMCSEVIKLAVQLRITLAGLEDIVKRDPTLRDGGVYAYEVAKDAIKKCAMAGGPPKSR